MAQFVERLDAQGSDMTGHKPPTSPVLAAHGLLDPSYSFPRHERQRLRRRPLRAATRLEEDRDSKNLHRFGSQSITLATSISSPWRQAWNPTRNVSPKALVLRAECLLERRFFVHRHKEMKKQPE
jgi:hypothetical protein